MRGGEALEMPDLQHQAAFRRQRGEVVRLGQGTGDRLFHQHVLAGAQCRGGEGVVRLGRRGHHQRVAGGEQGGKIHGRGSRFPPDRAGALVIRVVDANQCGAVGGGDLQCVVAAEMAGAGDADAEAGRGHGGNFRLILAVYSGFGRIGGGGGRRAEGGG